MVTNNRPNLSLDLSGHDGNVFVIINRTREMLTGLTLQHFNMDIGQTTLIGEGTTYKDILAIVNQYVRLIDGSGMYREYAIDQEAIVSAIDRFHEALDTFPDTVSCTLIGMVPDFDDPNCDADAYMQLLLQEIRDTERDIQLVGYESAEPLRQLLAMLQELVSALRRAGVA